MTGQRPSRIGWALGAAAAVAIAAALALMDRSDRQSPVNDSPIAAMLSPGGTNAADYARVTGPRPFRFPADHGPHEEYRAEWWYFTGNLDAADGRRFGYELTFFRFALAPRPVASASRWRTNQVYMAHFALTDPGSGRFRSFERYGRQALGLAGADRERLHVWLHDWSARAAKGGDAFPLQLHAAAGGIAIDLTLAAAKPVVLNGERGFSRKSAGPGQASYYYSLTRLPTSGTIAIDGHTVAVRGDSWMDREWSTSALSEAQSGWDWFALQLSDGRDLMFYRLRRKDGTRDPFSAGTLVEADGSARPLAADAVHIEPLGRWRSPHSGVLYPMGWRLNLPQVAIELTIEPLMADQELDVAFRYWEGAVRVRGRSGGLPVSGRGYVEMTGYTAAGGVAE